MENGIKIRPKILMKTIASILTTIMILQLFPAIVFGIQQTEVIQKDESIMKNEQEEKTNISDEIVGEIVEKRTLNEKHFLQEDGNVIATIYPSNVHYEENGELLDIDNSLEEIKDEEENYKNKKNSFEVKFAKKSNKSNLVKMQIKNHNIKWSLQNSNKVNATKLNKKNETEEKFKLKNISSGTIQYEDILEGINLQYNIISNSIKENIILKDKEAIIQPIVFEFQTEKLKMEKIEDGRIIFCEENKEEVLFFLDLPYMYDSKNEISKDIEMKLEEKNNKYIVSIIPNKEWLEDEKREYPIIIDPTVETSLNYQNIQDTYIFNGDTGYPNRHEAHILRVGSNNTIASKNATRSLIRFNLPELSAGDQVISAMLDICSYPDTNEWTPPSGKIQIDVHKMTGDWNVQTANWNSLSNQYDTRISDYIKYQYDSNNPAKFYYFDITRMVKDWYVTGNNYGLVLKEHTETYNASHSDVYFFSADINREYINARPMVQIVYRNQTGLENYQTYHTQTIGRAGKIHTNDYNGNLTLLHYDTSTPGQNLSVSVNHVYNTNDKEVDIGYGNGYRLNIAQTIEKVTIGSKEYAKYTDEDGTKHYFEKQQSEYKDTENLGLKLIFENEKFILKDKSNNQFIFHKNVGETWNLKQLVDANNKITNIEFMSNTGTRTLVKSITDSAGDSIQFSYNNNKLNKITDKASRAIQYEYDNNGNLTKITYHDGKSSQYSYTNKLLTSAKNIDGYHVNYEYHNEKSNRLKSIKEYGTQNTLGNSLTINYGDNITKFMDNKGYSNTYTFNNLGQTISISDFGKNENDIDHAYGKMYQYGEEQNNKNRLTLDGNLISIKEKENNLVKNSDFSKGLEGWLKTNCSENDKVENGVLKFVGNSNIDKNISQSLNIYGKKGDIYTLATWVNSKAVPNNSDRKIKISLTIHFVRNDGTKQVIDKNVNVDGTGWQYKSEVVMADSDYKNVIVYYVHSFNENETYFDNMGLFKEEFGQSYTYDDDGNIIKTAELAEGQKNYEYMNNKMIKEVNSNGTKYSYEYDYLNPTKLLSAKNSLGNKYNFNYDEDGNLISTQIVESTLNDSLNVGKYQFLRISDMEKFLTLNVSNEKIETEYYHGLNTQRFYINSSDESGYYKIVSYDDRNIVLDIDNNNNVIKANSNNNDSQKWQIESQSDATYKISNKQKGQEYCISLKNGNIIVAKDEGKMSQRISISGSLSSSVDKAYDNFLLETGEIYRIKSNSSNLYLQATENGNVIQKKYDKENKSQLWRVTRLDENRYKISNVASSKGYTMTASQNVENEEIKLKDNVDETRKWKIYRNGSNTYYIQTDVSGEDRVLTVKNNSKNEGEKTTLNLKNNLENQNFIFEKANLFEIKPNHYYRIKVQCSGMYLGISENMMVEQQTKDENNEEQKWLIKPLYDGTYQIYSPTAMMMTMQLADYYDNASDIKIGKKNNDDKLEIVARDDQTVCIKPISKQEDFAFGIENNSTVQNTKVKLSQSTDASGQKFYLEDAGIMEGNNLEQLIETTAKYSINGKYQTKMIDENNHTVDYEYNDNTGTISSEKTEDNQLEYTYDNLDRMTKVELKENNQVISKNEYSYENDKLKTIKAGNTNYYFIYDEFGNVKQIKIGNKTLVTNNYENNNGNLTSETFANNQSIHYGYDRFNRITEKSGSNGEYTYTYNADSNIKTIVDTVNANTKSFTYDLAQRLVKEINTNGFTAEYEYDINSNISNRTYTLNDIQNNIKYNFDNYNRLNSIVSYNSTLDSMWKRQTDALSRISKTVILSGKKQYETNYEYVNTDEENKKTTTLISKLTNEGNLPIEYEYYKNGNIKTIKEAHDVNYYYYDVAGELIRENNKQLNKTITYEYDSNGNILNKKEYSYTTVETLPTTPNKTIQYTYENENWTDQLTKYNGKPITYDAIGNIITYDGNTYTWQNGRQLAEINNTSKNQRIEYQYNENGIRTQKTVNGVTTKYFLDGTKVIYEQTGSDTISYIYDENGNVIGLKDKYEYPYYYLKNAQNDIIGILDGRLNQVVTYKYDSWGNTISIEDANGNQITDTNHIGIMNPYRYKSYRYDTETGLYYLQSRYYNPEWGRFINFDNYAGRIGEIFSHNGYVYCKNNPINLIDENGNFAIALSALFTTMVQAIVYTIATVVTAITATAATEAAVDYVKEQEVKRNQKSHTVYQLRNEDTKQIDYVGRTVNPTTRKKNHQKTKPNHSFEVIATGLTREEARGVEQIYMIEYNTKSLLNRINGINPNNIKREIYMEAGRQIIKYLGNVVSNEALYWTGQ